MYNRFNFDPNQHYKLNAPLLVLSVIVGLVIGIIIRSSIPLILLPVLSQYKWIKDLIIRFENKDDIKAIARLSNSAKLTDKADARTVGRYKATATYDIEDYSSYKLIKINANGVRSTRVLDSLANDVAAAFHKPAYLIKIENGIATYRIDMKGGTSRHVNESNF